MLIDLRELCNKYKFIPNGIVHVGAHKAEEFGVYNSLGVENVVWVEANPKLIEEIKSKIPTNQKILNYLVSDVDDKEYTFYITNNGESSSLLELEKHKIHHPHIYVTETNILKSKTLDSIIEIENLDIRKFNFLNLDIQGAELMALKGFSKNLSNFKYVYTEINTNNIYKNCALLDEMDSFLLEFGFERKETKITEYEWGDGFYIKKEI